MPRQNQQQESAISEDASNGVSAVITVALLVVAVFGGALVGGVVSGDPSNGFYLTIIVASSVAICIAIVISSRYYCRDKPRASKRDPNGVSLRRTFTGSNDEEDKGAYDVEHQAPARPARTPVEKRDRKSVV